MKNLNIHVSSEMLRDHVYCVSRSSGAYSFFHCEYPNVPENGFGFLFTSDDKKKSSFETFIQAFRGRIFRKDCSVLIPSGSMGHMYFASEYPKTFMEDSDHNMIVPEEIIYSGRAK